MNRCEWIVCERGNRWATALRTALARQGATHRRPPRLREVRSPAELTQRFDASPQSFAMFEVHAANLGKVLDWLAEAVRRYPSGRFAALLDSSLTSPDANGSSLSDVDRQNVVDALIEAGARGVAVSPRRLQHILALSERHWADVALGMEPAQSNLSLVEWAWCQLPWQDS
jgi:predicted TIM-barrel fold metal-dependent hydrolase